MRIAVLTALTNNRHRDGLTDFVLKNPYEGVDYYAFVDRPYECKSWKQYSLYNFSRIDDQFGPRREAKLPKILGSILVPGYDYYIWHDPYLELAVNPNYIIENIMGNKDFALFKHPERNCAYDEITELKRIARLENEENLIGMENFLAKKEFPRNNGLFELPAFMYRNGPKVVSAMLSWWELICKYSSRDQVSFPYIQKEYNLTYGIIPGTPRNHDGGNNIIPEVKPHWV